MYRPFRRAGRRLCALGLLAALLPAMIGPARAKAEAVAPSENVIYSLLTETERGTAGAGVRPLEEYEGKRPALLFAEEGGSAAFHVTITRAGRYALCLTYQPAQGAPYGETAIDVQADGAGIAGDKAEIPLERPWIGTGDFTADAKGNDVRVEQTPVEGWLQKTLTDPLGRVNGPLELELDAGAHTLTIRLLQGPFYLAGVELVTVGTAPAYEDAAAAYRAKGYADAAGEPIRVEAERFSAKSDSTILPGYEKSDAAASPSDPALLKYNIIPGSKYQNPGQWIQWRIQVEDPGLYTIRLRVRQNYKSGFFSCRRLTIDGELPFAECASLRFPSTSGWSVRELGEEGEPYLFYLNAGPHDLRLEVAPGAAAQIAGAVDDAIYRLNDVYRSVVMIAGTTPDAYRDYKLKDEIPGLPDELEGLRETLAGIERQVRELNAVAGSELSSLRALINLLEVFREEPDRLAKKLSTFKSNIEALSAWNLNLKVQPLDVDYLWLAARGDEAPRARAGFFEGLLFGARRLLNSFLGDYGTAGAADGARETLDVWLTLGRDQMQVLHELTNSAFTPETGISVNLSLVSAGIREAVLAGKAPDAALFLTSDEPVNLGVRGALADLKAFPGYADVLARFRPQATKPFELRGGCYALPLTETFPMLFARTDILSELGLPIPETWEDMYDAAAVLQRRHMEIGIPSTAGMYATLLFQNGGDFYTGDGGAAAFDTAAGIAAFETWTGFFAQYGFPLTYDFYNRFRSGEMPIGIAPYTTYTLLQSAAPEISGQWEMAPIPGTRRADGGLDRTAGISQSVGTGLSPGLDQSLQAAVIFSTSRRKEAAFAYLDWFTGTEAQRQFGAGLEAAMGATGRYATANVEAFEALPWRAKQRDLLLEQWRGVRLLPEIPGSYYVARNLNNAFRRVVNNKEAPVDVINRYNERINKEIARKRMEFDLA